MMIRGNQPSHYHHHQQPHSSSFYNKEIRKMIEKKLEKEKAKEHRQLLINTVVSWTLQDVLNPDLYKDKVETIPETFSSVEHYFNSFRYPLLEEIHSDMYASIENLSSSQTCSISSIKIARGYKQPDNLVYRITIGGRYLPYRNDVIALLDERPSTLENLSRAERLYVPAIVLDVRNKRKYKILHIRASKPIMGEDHEKKMITPQFAVSLINLIPSLRIWETLQCGRNLNVIEKVLSSASQDEDSCGMCSQQATCLQVPDLHSFNLNESQLDAVLSSVETSKCDHKSSIKLIWGPPGTGKTKTVSVLLFELLKMKCKTLTCAPTNTAIVEVTSRLMKIIKGPPQHGCSYGLGDIVLLGNEDRLKIDEHDDLADVFLDKRIEVLGKFFCSFSKWRSWVETMKSLLTDSYQQYHKYLKNKKSTKTEKPSCCLFCPKIDQTDKLEDEKLSIALRIGLFMRKQLSGFEQEMSYCIKCIRTHMPTRIISVEMMDNMQRALALLKHFISLVQEGSFTEEQIKIIFSSSGTVVNDPSLLLLGTSRNECLEILCSLAKISIRTFSNDAAIRKFCLQNAPLIFCTTSSSARLCGVQKTRLVIIDEAAQLKECESGIPLQLPDVQHAILVGDERQLPAMVQSKISEDAKFGRSLFERLASLEHKRHLLDVQYRMHPSISLFPNAEFYGKKISDASYVQERSYTKDLLPGNMYGPYSFIDISYGGEEYDNKYSLKNMTEVAVISEIIENLFKASVANGQKVSVGVISPYNAQVIALSEKLGDKYGTHCDFSVNVRSVDGFQGGEEDVIIISTVRSNEKGSIGFLSKEQRTNVALTRARHCLWILGDGQTLMNSGSVWRNIVLDAKDRRCYFKADADKRLSEVIIDSLIEHGQFKDLMSLLLKEARWEVIYEAGFWESFVRIKSFVTRKAAVTLLRKLLSGWRDRRSSLGNRQVVKGPSSQLLKWNHVNGQYKLLWTTDIVMDNSKYIQVLKFLYILPETEIPRLAKYLDSAFGSYPVVKMNFCKFKCFEGTLEVPKSWDIDWDNKQDDFVESLSCQLQGLRFV